MTFMYVDCETMGLDLMTHDVFEVAWALDDGPVHSGFVSHSYLPHEKKALEVNGYHRRMFGQDKDLNDDVLGELLAALLSLKGKATVVGANPHFDMIRLAKRWGWVEPWHYRAIDLSVLAMPLFGWEKPRGLQDVAAGLVKAGYDVPSNDHTAAGDVTCARAAHRALTDLSCNMAQVRS